MLNDAAWPGSSPAPDPRLASVQQVLVLLTRRPLLLAVTLLHTVADEQYDITVSKAVDDAGQVQPVFWWDVDRLAHDTQGQPHRERRWGRRTYETAAAAYLEAVHSVERANHSG